MVSAHHSPLDLLQVERPERLDNDHRLHITVSKRHLLRQRFDLDGQNAVMHQWKDLAADIPGVISSDLISRISFLSETESESQSVIENRRT